MKARLLRVKMFSSDRLTDGDVGTSPTSLEAQLNQWLQAAGERQVVNVAYTLDAYPTKATGAGSSTYSETGGQSGTRYTGGGSTATSYAINDGTSNNGTLNWAGQEMNYETKLRHTAMLTYAEG